MQTAALPRSAPEVHLWFAGSPRIESQLVGREGAMHESQGEQHPRQGYVGRFAPSPSGPLHAGSLHAAVLSWLDARRAGGRWLLRIEDIDGPRTVPGAADAILRSLDRHGLHWDGAVIYQSTRDDAYADALSRLARAGVIFACTCTRRTLRALGGPYPGTCRARRRGAGAQEAPAGALRCRVAAGALSFDDRRLGTTSEALDASCGDFIVRRRDGLWAYQLAVVVDDAAAGVTDVVRGEDLLDSTARQLWLQIALGLPTPRYPHHDLVLGLDGDKLSKQTGAPGVDDACARENLHAALARLGIESEPADPVEAQLQHALAASPEARSATISPESTNPGRP